MRWTTYFHGVLASAAMTWLLAVAAPALAQERAQRHDPATETCDSYDQDVTGDIALLQQDARSLDAAASGGAELPAIEVARAYTVTLHSQADVTFSTEPSRVMLADGAFAGHMEFRVPVSGQYRISMTDESWVDILDGGEYLDAAAFAGRVGCKPLRKLVDYKLEANKPYVLMLSGGSKDVVGVAIRPVHHP